ncbi:MAG: hypothetical protein AB7V27_09835 [Candidatus Binatia bacterium]
MADPLAIPAVALQPTFGPKAPAARHLVAALARAERHIVSEMRGAGAVFSRGQARYVLVSDAVIVLSDRRARLAGAPPSSGCRRMPTVSARRARGTPWIWASLVRA